MLVYARDKTARILTIPPSTSTLMPDRVSIAGMATAYPRLAKLARPEFSGTIRRDRLFDTLDALDARQALWISGPAGSGKTALVSSFLDTRGLESIWYHVDSGDRDPSTFFYYLAQAVAKRRAPLPLLTPEYLPDLLGFARRFMRAWFSRVQPGTWVVLDGFHEIDDAVDWSPVLGETLLEIPDGIRLVVISRSEAPAVLSRHRANGILRTLGGAALKLRHEEVDAMVAEAASGPRTASGEPDAVDHLLERCDGWAAGLRLMLEPGLPRGNVNFGVSVPTVFAYFAAEVFERQPRDVRDFLLAISVLPIVTVPLAAAVSGYRNSGQLLVALHERNLFVERLRDREGHYRLHGLFRDFLSSRLEQDRREHAEAARVSDIARAEERLDIRTLQSRAARLLEEHHDPDTAIDLFLQAGEWAAASRLIADTAPSLILQGRWPTVLRWIRALPAFLVARSPTLLYCQGGAQVAHSPLDARSTLTRAFDGFRESRDHQGELITAAAIAETFYFEYDSYQGLDRWIDLLHELLKAYPGVLSPEAELHAYSTLQIAMTLHEPGHPFLARCSERVLDLLARQISTNLRVRAGALMLTYCGWMAPERGREVVEAVRPLLGSSDVTPLNRIWWLLAECHHHRFEANTPRARQVMDEIRVMVARSGLRPPESVLPVLEVWIATGGGDLEGADKSAQQLQQVATLGRRQDRLLYRAVIAEWLLARGDTESAIDHAEDALEMSRETGLVLQGVLALTMLAVALATLDRAFEAQERLVEARRMMGNAKSARFDFQFYLVNAFCHLEAHRKAEARESLEKALMLGREHGFTGSLVWVPWMMSKLCAHAMVADIETEYVRRLVATRRVPSPDAALEAWPWPVRIRTFGRFEIQLNGSPLGFKGKAPKRPLELLKGLLSRGARGVDAQSLWETLWPDSDGDDAAGAFKMALHRLRKLLGNDDALLLEDGTLSVNPSHCWIDSLAFEAKCASTSSSNTAEPDLEAAIALYRGHFLESEPVQSWMLPARDRYRSRMHRTVSALARTLEARGILDEAADVYRRGLEVDELAESFYQGLMNCLIGMGQNAEAVRIYQRCRTNLAAHLGVAPSQQTDDLLRRAKAEAASPGQA